MKWPYIIKQKMRAALALGVVFLLVLLTSFSNKSNFQKIHSSFSSVYEDRLFAESYIYKLSILLNSKATLINSYNSSVKPVFDIDNKSINDSIRVLISEYEETKLTKEEEVVFEEVKSELQELLVLESKLVNPKTLPREEGLLLSIKEKHEDLSLNLNRLSEIQLSEAKSLIDSSKRIIAGNNITSTLELAVLIIIGIFIQALIFASKSGIPKFKQKKSSLN